MTDVNTKIKNRVYRTYDLNTLWIKLRKEGFTVYEAEDYEHGEQSPYHLYHIETDSGSFIADVMYRNYTEQEMQEAKELGLTPFKQEIEWMEY